MSTASSSPLVGLYCACATPSLVTRAQSLSQLYHYPLVSTPPEQLPKGGFVLVLNESILALQATGTKVSGPITVDFVSGANAHRRQFGGGKGQMIAKAIGLKGSFRPQVVDVTAGLGQDAFVLASLGCSVVLLERSPIIYSLLEDGVARAKCLGSNELQTIMSRFQLKHQHGESYLRALCTPADVIYLDPMFPERTNTAAVNKSMKAFHDLLGEDSDAGELLAVALAAATYRVVVKRPRKAPALDEQYPRLHLPKPGIVFVGKSTRFDVYPQKKMPQ